jgi:hypothetical protein
LKILLSLENPVIINKYLQGYDPLLKITALIMVFEYLFQMYHNEWNESDNKYEVPYP